MDWDYQIARVLPKMFLVFFLGMIYWSLMAYLGSRNPSKNLKVYPQLNFWGQAALIFAVMFGGLLFVDKKTKDLIKQNRIVAKALACFMVLSNISVSIWQMYNNIHLLENGNLEELKILIRYRIGVLFGTGENVFDYYIHRPLWFTITTIGYAIYIFNFKRSDSKWFTKLRKAIGLLFLPAVIFMTSYFIEGWNFYDILFKLLNILILYLLLATYTWKKKKINDKTTITNDKVVKDEIVNEIITPNTKDKMIDTAEQNKEEIDIKELIKPEEVVNIEIEESQATENKPQTTPNEKPKEKKKKTWKKVLFWIGITLLSIIVLTGIGIGLGYYIERTNNDKEFERIENTQIINRNFLGHQLGDSLKIENILKEGFLVLGEHGYNYVFTDVKYGYYKFDYISFKEIDGIFYEVIMLLQTHEIDEGYEIFRTMLNKLYRDKLTYRYIPENCSYYEKHPKYKPHYARTDDYHMSYSDPYTTIELLKVSYVNNFNFYYYDEIIESFWNDVDYGDFANNVEDITSLGRNSFRGIVIRYRDRYLYHKYRKIRELKRSEGF